MDHPASPSAGNADFSFGRGQRVFDSLPKSDARRRRALEVQRFRSPVPPGKQPRWNSSTVDEAHPFPERANTNSIGRYNGVEVVERHFPETVKGTAALRSTDGDPLRKTGVWSTNQQKALSSSRYTFHMPSSTTAEATDADLSYLARVIVEDNTPEKVALRQHWCASTVLDGRMGNRFVAPTQEPLDYVAHNKEKQGIADSLRKSYQSPQQRAEKRYRDLQQEKQWRADAKDEAAERPYERADAPAVFTMSNIDSWWSLDPVQVSAEQRARKEESLRNPYLRSAAHSPSGV